LHRHDPGSAFTISFSVLPALTVGDVDADIEFASPVFRLAPARSSLLLEPKIPIPAIRISSPSARASLMAGNAPSTASLATTLLRPVRAASRSAISSLFNRCPPPPTCPPSRLPSSIRVVQRTVADCHRGRIQQSAVRWQRQPVPARMLPCAEVRPLAIGVATTLRDLSPCEALHPQFIRVPIALAGFDDTRLRRHGTRSRAMLLRTAGGVERAPALGIGAQALSQHLLDHMDHERLDRLHRRTRARRRFPDGCHALPICVHHVNTRIVFAADAPRTRRLAARAVQIVPLGFLTAGSLRRVSPFRHGASETGFKRFLTGEK